VPIDASLNALARHALLIVLAAGCTWARAEPANNAYRLQLDASQYQVKPQSTWQMPAPDTVNTVTDARPYAQAIEAAAGAAGIETELLHAVVKAESNYRADARSHKGAQGLAQLMPGTAAMYDARALTNARRNLEVGARYLRSLLDQFEQDVALAVAAYNAGPGAVTRYGGIPPYAETQTYVKRVLGEYAALKAERKTIPQPWQLGSSVGDFRAQPLDGR